ncbi:hypothetical protein ACQPZP_34250 [Spirillospora sp. CA-142024]|uniref:hypothetical protein n=1 Tax=Spirillospora sp. CA-142024 TaxID=3240036 RepID=UPI003D94A2D9
MSGRTRIFAASTALATGLVAGCDTGSQCTVATIAEAYEIYSPIVFTVLPEVLPKTVPGLAVNLGVFTVDTLAKYLIEHKVKPNRTWLLIEQAIQGQRKTTVFEIGTGRELKVTMNVNGQELQRFAFYVKERQFKVVIPENSMTRVSVTDTSAGDGVARHGKVDQNLHGTRDLETAKVFRHELGQADPPEARAGDIRAKSFTGSMDLVNGAQAARFTGKGRPTIAACRSMPGAAWSNKFQDYGSKDKYLVWCIKTGSGHYGMATPDTSDGKGVFYLLWVQPGLPAPSVAPTPKKDVKIC